MKEVKPVHEKVRLQSLFLDDKILRGWKKAQKKVDSFQNVSVDIFHVVKHCNEFVGKQNETFSVKNETSLV